jgi:hypothetical protein
VTVDERADELVTEAFSGRIDWQHLTGGQGIGFTLRIGENDVLPGCHLAAVIEPHGS